MKRNIIDKDKYGSAVNFLYILIKSLELMSDE